MNKVALSTEITARQFSGKTANFVLNGVQYLVTYIVQRVEIFPDLNTVEFSYRLAICVS